MVLSHFKDQTEFESVSVTGLEVCMEWAIHYETVAVWVWNILFQHEIFYLSMKSFCSVSGTALD